MIGKDEYVWVFNKKMKNWWGPSFGEPLNLTDFENIYISIGLGSKLGLRTLAL